jgi:hypothetical protein
VPSKVKREIKAEAIESYLMKMPPAIAATPMVYDPAAELLYLGTGSTKQIEDFIGFFYQTMNLEPLQITPGTMLNEEFGKLETDLPILSLTDEPCTDMLIGRDFLTYLWYLSETGAVEISHPQYGEFDLLVEGPLVFGAGDLAKGSAETSVKKGDLPQQSAEAKAALAVGKKLKKAKVTLTRGEDIWSGTFDADKFVFSSMNLPEGEELDPDSRFGERMQNIFIFNEAWKCCFKLFAQNLVGTFSFIQTDEPDLRTIGETEHAFGAVEIPANPGETPLQHFGHGITADGVAAAPEVTADHRVTAAGTTQCPGCQRTA